MSTNSIELGDCRSPEHYAVHGTPVRFYVWIREGSQAPGMASNWVRGDASTHHKLQKLRAKDRANFVELVKQIFKDNT